MLDEKYIPTPLIFPSERSKIDIIEQKTNLAWRGWFLIYQLILLHLRFAKLFINRQLTATQYAAELRIFLETMGSLWICAGQMIALRRDIFSLEVSEELAKLNDKGKAIAFSDIRSVIEQDLNIVLEDEFESFSETPFASTIVSQTHRAFLKQKQKWVAVKVLHPNAEALFNRDLQLIGQVIRILYFFNIHANMRWLQLYHEINEIRSRELDLRYEASTLDTLRKNLVNHGIHVPVVFAKQSDIHVLTIEYITGALMSDYIHLRKTDPKRLSKWLIENHIDSDKIAKILFNSVYRQIFEDNFFHSDIHPGNIILLRNNRLAIINCRSVGWLESERLAKLRTIIESLANNEYSTAADTYFLLASKLPLVDLSEVKFQMIRTWRVWEIRSYIKDLPYDEKSISYMFREINQIVFSNKFATDWSTEKLARAWGNLDMSLTYLRPEINYLKWLRRYFDEASNRKLYRELEQLPMRTQRGIANLEQTRKVISEYMSLQQSIVRRQALRFQGSTTKIGNVISAVLSFTSLVAIFINLFLILTCIYQYHPHDFSWQVSLGNQIFSLMLRLPLLKTWEWTLLLSVTIFTNYKVISIKRYFQENDIRLPDVSVSA